MLTEFYAFGEVLWDCLPSGRHAGGAPFNVCAHLAQLGVSASLISSVGRDALGDELLSLAVEKGVNAAFVGRAGPDLATGTVRVTLDGDSNASYEIVEPVAWDEIKVTGRVRDAVAQARALVFGSLAVRGAFNLASLEGLLAIPGPLKCFDVNLRAPFVDLPLVLRLAGRADVVKLNEEELGLLAGWVRSGTMTGSRLGTVADVAEGCAVLAGAAGVSRVCVTRGGAGAVLWDGGVVVSSGAPSVVVRDTVGAGDAFMAGLVLGLVRGLGAEEVLARACGLGAFVASQDGATPRLPGELVGEH